MGRSDAVGIPLRQLAERCGAELSGDGDVLIDRVATLDAAGKGAIAFLANPKDKTRLAAPPAKPGLAATGVAAATSFPKPIPAEPIPALARRAAIIDPA